MRLNRLANKIKFDQRGVSITEYALLCSVIMPMLVLALASSGDSISSKLYIANAAIQNVQFGQVYSPRDPDNSGLGGNISLNPIAAANSPVFGGGSQTTGGGTGGNESNPQAEINTINAPGHPGRLTNRIPKIAETPYF